MGFVKQRDYAMLLDLTGTTSLTNYLLCSMAVTS